MSELNIENLIPKIHEFYEISGEISKKYKELAKHSNGNILDCLNLKEPDHSRLLAGILNYYSNNEPEILNSFIQMLSDKCESIETAIKYLKNTRVDTEQWHIDCLISDYKNYAIIIENKIYFATDQETQIERYIESVQDLGIKNENIYVVYLTKDGSKQIERHSFTEKAKSALDYTESNKGRFIEANYKDDILPWLQSIVLELRNKDHLFIEFIDQYIDELNGEFRLREIDKGEDMHMVDELNKALGIDGKNDKEKILKITEIRKELNSVIETMDKSVKTIIEPLFIDAFGNSIRDKYAHLNPNDHMSSGWYQIFIDGFHRDFHFELMYKSDIPNIEKISICLHTERTMGKYKKLLEQDKKFMDIVKKKGYVSGVGKYEVVYKDIEFNDKLINVIDTEIPKIVEKEYADMNEIASYLIDNYKDIE